MSLETAILKLAEAIEENTKAAALVVTPTTAAAPEVVEATPEPTKKPAAKKAAPKKTAKPKAKAPDPEPEPEETPAEEVEEVEEEEATEEEESFPTDRTEALAKITEFVRDAFVNADDGGAAGKEKFSALRESYGVDRASEVPDKLLEKFYNDTVEALS